MTTNSDFKRLVRTRMEKTGESYTAARAQLVGRDPNRSPLTRVVPATPKPDFAQLAGMSDTAVKAKTGCTWERWVYALDRVEAHKWPHRDIARHIRDTYKTPSWWTQMVTVGYERIKGLRTVGERREGGFEASKSKTFAAPLPRLYRAFHDGRARSRWLPGVKFKIRKATPDRSLRITWPDGTSVDAMFFAKGRGRSQVQIQHGRFPDRETATRIKRYWGERLSELAESLG
jgi:uncharacterized protein YndB with AHSA1/START domain